MSRLSAPTRVPVGTQVAVHGTAVDAAGPGTGRGLAGRVVREADGTYTVALVDGRLVEVAPDELSSLADPPTQLPEPVRSGAADDLVAARTLFAAAVGHQPADPAAELTVRAVFQAPTAAFWSLRKPPEQVAGPGPWLSWEVEQFCRLALDADPVCLELLWSPRRIWVSDIGRELLDLRPAFLSQTISAAYADHVLAGFTRLAGDDDPDEEQAAAAADLLRLLVDGQSLLRTGDVGAPSREHRERLAAVRAGALPWEQVDAYRLELQQQLDEAAAVSFLSPGPDTGRVDAWLSDLRRRDLDATP
ncbi:DNA polymerase beta superfamily protein [Jiangella rhizosphaerae]|uniref:Nucleotidyltransferase n=1 Tax=Jiangella rhizosphaerae TaxID=2293569 RepID=A0A418KIB8_9ACTN|nr:nucleotidyltransferase domain-containing protein [Jiangella rhizosphaerae]RIQ12901.1 nucleotidyltransferase [Jiangella rhizosphaerae]